MVGFIGLCLYSLFKGKQFAYLARWGGVQKGVAEVVLVKTFQTVYFTIILIR